MSSIVNSLNNRFQVPLTPFLTSSKAKGYAFNRVKNQVTANIASAALNDEAHFNNSPELIDRIVYYVPQPDLLQLSSTCRFLYKFLETRCQLFRMNLNSREAIIHFIEFLDSLKDDEFVGIQKLKFSPDYQITEAEFLTLVKHLPALRQVALPDLEQVSKKAIEQLDKIVTLRRVDLFKEHDSAQLSPIDDKNDAPVKIYVKGRKTMNGVNRCAENYNKKITLAFCAFVVTSIVSQIFLAIFLTKTETGKNTYFSILSINFSACIILPIVWCAFYLIIKCIAIHRVNRDEYEILVNV